MGMRPQGNMNDTTKTVYDAQIRTDGNMTKAVYDTQARTGDSMTNAGYDTQIRTSGIPQTKIVNAGYGTQLGTSGTSQTKIVNGGYDAQMRTTGIPQTKIANAGYDTQLGTSGISQTKIANAGYDTQMRTSGLPQTEIVTNPNPVYNEVPKPAPPRPRGTNYGGGDERAFDTVGLPRPRGTDYGGADKRAFDAVDTNKDGVISFDEFTAARAASNPANGSERQTRMQTQKYQVPVTKYYKRTVMETRERQVPVPYYDDVPETKYQTVTEKVPVKKSKVEVDNVTKTVYEPQMRTRCVPRTKMVKKQIPVYNVVPKPAPPCPLGTDCGGGPVGNPVPTYLE